jgi:predicted ester cyclase
LRATAGAASLPSVTAATPPIGVSNGELVRWLFEVVNERDLETLRRFWTPQTIERFPDGTCHGADAIAAYFATAFAALPDWRMRVVSIVEQGEDVFVRWQLTGTHAGGAFQGIEATGRAVALDGIDHFVVRGGVVVTNFVVFDQMQFARQIGLLPRDGSRADRALKAAFNARTRLARRLRR